MMHVITIGYFLREYAIYDAMVKTYACFSIHIDPTYVFIISKLMSLRTNNFNGIPVTHV